MSNSPYWINHKKKIVLIFSPKSACTTLQYGFIKKFSEIKKEDCPRKIAKEFNFVQNDYNKIPKNYFIYWGIRDPFDRIVSCYMNKFILYKKKRLNKNNLENCANNFLKKIKIDYDNLTFNKFLDGIKYLISRNVNINNHFDTAVNIKNYNKIKNHPNLIIFDINNIPKCLKINKVINKTIITNNVLIKNVCNMKTKNITLDLLIKKNFLESKKLIKEIYKNDYNIFKKHNFIY
jgi:hypothetical protein